MVRHPPSPFFLTPSLCFCLGRAGSRPRTAELCSAQARTRPARLAQGSGFFDAQIPRAAPSWETQISVLSSSFSLHSAPYLFWDRLNHANTRTYFSEPAPLSCVSTNGPDKPVACLERWSPPPSQPPPSNSCNLTPPGNLAWRIQGVTCHLLETESRNLQQTAYIKSNEWKEKKKKKTLSRLHGDSEATQPFSPGCCACCRDIK